MWDVSHQQDGAHQQLTHNLTELTSSMEWTSKGLCMMGEPFCMMDVPASYFQKDLTLKSGSNMPPSEMRVCVDAYELPLTMRLNRNFRAPKLE